MKTVAQTVIEADHFYTIAAHTGNVIQAVEGAKEGGTVRLGKYEHKPEQEWSFVRVDFGRPPKDENRFQRQAAGYSGSDNGLLRGAGGG